MPISGLYFPIFVPVELTRTPSVATQTSEFRPKGCIHTLRNNGNIWTQNNPILHMEEKTHQTKFDLSQRVRRRWHRELIRICSRHCLHRVCRQRRVLPTSTRDIHRCISSFSRRGRLHMGASLHSPLTLCCGPTCVEVGERHTICIRYEAQTHLSMLPLLYSQSRSDRLRIIHNKLLTSSHIFSHPNDRRG